MLKVGLTGGIGAGKSEVSRLLDSYGAVIVDADKIAREVVEPGTPGLAAVVQEFGAGILTPEGTLDRQRLGSVVFADSDRLAALNAIVHPLVGERSAELERAAVEEERAGGEESPAVVVHDVPLIAENGLAPLYDLVVVVDASPGTQLERLTRVRGMSREEAAARMAAQATRAERLAVADIVIDNDGTLADLEARVREVWEELRRRAAAARS
ncbi:dephospho-CoA kinase [Streptomyces daqingensis]|nr:dephospho-CoA kinase [Streptomyces daqingensis]